MLLLDQARYLRASEIRLVRPPLLSALGLA